MTLRANVARRTEATIGGGSTKSCMTIPIRGTAATFKSPPPKSVIEILQQSTRRLGFLCEVIGVIPVVSMDVNQCEIVIAEDTPVVVDAVGKIPKWHAVHHALFAIKAVDVSGCEKERRTGLNDARDIRNRPNRVIGIEMEHDAPRNHSIEPAIGKRAGLNNSFNSKSFRAVAPKVFQHRA
jgi:hypothetical protein